MLRRITTFFTGIACGAVVGAVVAQLLTPKDGATRQQEFKAYTEQLKATSEEVAEQRRQALHRELANKINLQDNDASEA